MSPSEYARTVKWEAKQYIRTRAYYYCGTGVGRGNYRSLVNVGVKQGMGSIDSNETRLKLSGP